MKRCPYCSEEIQDEAVKCRFCGEWLMDPGEELQVPVTGIPLPVTYELVGLSVGATVSYRKAGGEVAEEAISLPWEFSFHAHEQDLLSLSVRNDDPSGFSFITARILLEGRAVKSCSARGRYTSCSIELVVPAGSHPGWSREGPGALEPRGD